MVTALSGHALMLAFWSNTSFILVVLFLGKMGISASFMISYISFVKLIPSMHSASVFGLSNVMARVSTSVAPVIAELDFPVPIVVNMIMFAVAIVASLNLVEKLPKHM